MTKYASFYWSSLVYHCTGLVKMSRTAIYNINLSYFIFIAHYYNKNNEDNYKNTTELYNLAVYDYA